MISDLGLAAVRGGGNAVHKMLRRMCLRIGEEGNIFVQNIFLHLSIADVVRI